MKILQIFPGKIWGGAEQYVVDLGHELSERGHEVSYLSRPSGAVTARLDERGLPYRTLPFRWSLDHASISGLAAMLRDSDVDVIHVHGMMFVPIAEIARRCAGSRARVVMTRHDAHRTPVGLLYRRFFRRMHRIIFVSRMVKERWLGANRWFDESKTCVIHNSIPPYPRIDVPSLRDTYGIPPTTPLILFSGRVRKSKGCGVLVEALGLIADCDFALVMIGAPKPADYTGELVKIARRHGIADRVHFHPFTPDARQYIRQADIAVAPSVIRDSCPLSNLEFIQAGVCEVTTNNGGQAEYLTDGVNALLVDPGDAGQLAAALARVIDDKALRDRLAAAGRRLFESEMTYDKFTDRVLEAYS